MAASGKSLQEKFQYALDMVKSLPKPSPSDPVQFSNDDKLQMYALFKQADQGPCCTNRPGMFDVVGRYKWDAWKALGDISKEEAMQRYLDTMISHAKRFPGSASLQEFLRAIEAPEPTPAEAPPASGDPADPPEDTTEPVANAGEPDTRSEPSRDVESGGEAALVGASPGDGAEPAKLLSDENPREPKQQLSGDGVADPAALTGDSFTTSTPRAARPRRVRGDNLEQIRPRSRALFQDEPRPVSATVEEIYADDPATTAWLQTIQQDLARTTERVAAMEVELRGRSERSMRRNSNSALRWLRQRNDASTVLWILWPVLVALLVQRYGSQRQKR